MNTFKELLAEIESYIGKMSTGPYDLVGMQYEEAMERLSNIRGEFEAVRDAAEKAFNIKWDISGMNLPEMKGAVAEIAGMFQDLYARVSETSRQIEASGASVDAWTGHLTDAQLALSEFKAKTEGFQETMGMLFDDAPKDLDALKDAMKNVEAAYADVVSAGAAAVDALKGQWDDLAGKIAETEEKIKALYADTAETIRELQRKTMSDEKAWLDEKLEANQVYNQAVAEMNQGNVDAALELFAKARDIAKGLAQEVKDESGQVVMSLEQNTETAISMITQISDAEKNILQSHQQELITNQAKVGQSIDQTLTKMQELSAKASQIDRDMPDWWYDMEGPDWPPQFAEGGLAAGPKHSRGGMIIEVEGGEYVQPDKAMSRYGRLGLAFQEAFRQMKIPKGALAELMERLTMGGLSRAEWGTRLLSGAANAMAHIEMIVPKFETGGAVAGAGAMAGGFDLGIKDMGRTDLNFDGKAYPVMGKVDVLAELQAAFARKKRLRSNS